MKFYGKAEEAANRILEVFQSGILPKALALILIKRKDNVPCRSWSWSNQLLVAAHGHHDARRHRQWQEVGRYVKKGERSFAILAPLTKKVEDEETGEEQTITYGFKAVPVFGLSQTDGEPLPDLDLEVAAWVESLPLREVAESWGLSVETFNASSESRYHGLYRHQQGIALGVRNLATWTHELIHAADDRCCGGLNRGQHWDQEIVAELGGAVLLEILGQETESDRGGCWEYVKAYADKAKIQPIVACQRLLKRMCDAVALILDTAETIAYPAEAVT